MLINVNELISHMTQDMMHNFLCEHQNVMDLSENAKLVRHSFLFNIFTLCHYWPMFKLELLHHLCNVNNKGHCKQHGQLVAKTTQNFTCISNSIIFKPARYDTLASGLKW